MIDLKVCLPRGLKVIQYIIAWIWENPSHFLTLLVKEYSARKHKMEEKAEREAGKEKKWEQGSFWLQAKPLSINKKYEVSSGCQLTQVGKTMDQGGRLPHNLMFSVTLFHQQKLDAYSLEAKAKKTLTSDTISQKKKKMNIITEQSLSFIPVLLYYIYKYLKSSMFFFEWNFDTVCHF